jgi:hypothetical protein
MVSVNASTYLLLIFFFITCKFLWSTFRNKLIYFLLGILSSSLWGFFCSLDGLVLILITTELTAILLLVMTYTKILTIITLHKSYKATALIYLPLIVFFSTKPLTLSYSFTSYYCLVSEIIASDFFILYNILFTDFVQITLLLIIIISVFSIFFILLYFNLKLSKAESFSKNLQKFCLRKQTMQKQTKFNAKLSTFQN